MRSTSWSTPRTSSATPSPCPEGLRVVDIVDVLAKNTDFSKAQYQKVLASPDKIGLPDYAEGNPEGYLFPSTYDIGPDATPASILTAMVDRWEQAAEDAGLEERAAELGYTPHELMTVASLVEAEASRRAGPGQGRPGDLQPDREPRHRRHDRPAADRRDHQLRARPRPRVRDLDGGPRVRLAVQHLLAEGLPPGPIEAPGDAAIEAAGNPTEGDWYYYVTVNLRTGETKFAESYDEFLTYDAEFDAYCDDLRRLLRRPTMHCAVLGDPIAHSLSPVLHRAAYAATGLDWDYDAHRVPAGGLAGFVAGLDDAWRGLSLTMPLKREALDLARR